MLVLERKIGQRIHIRVPGHPDIVVIVHEVVNRVGDDHRLNSRVRLAIDAANHIDIVRAELLKEPK